ncbi:uracil-DNA glycosylase [Namhaeicola litoreus]|uniref:Uracil-DNA glycosylase n=1 Tax=Namhaeicola litoreus TaxID=1052145 RepID=A0ABW3Y177_9FLAO
MDIKIERSWYKILKDEFEEDYFISLIEFVKNEYRENTCYPKGKEIFKAFDACPFDKVKVVIIGQDPYHGPNQANGLCFSVHKGIQHPPSLINIFKELENDVQKSYPDNGDLSSWAEQGVLLLNATLTVRSGQAGSHQKKGWERFTDAVIASLSENQQNIVFLLWGGFAKQKGSKIDRNKHLILTSGHPSPLSANRGYWFGNKHFSKANDYLIQIGKTPITW